ncbi:MAG: M3 family oligoendopeptidase [Alphaproteobacteria bacterium]|nr:M3 family oligoendopeptidase [Alphaproteobacteria bacterium]
MATKPVKKTVGKTTAKATVKAKEKPLPVWDLGDLYAGPNDPALARDFKRFDKKATVFAKAYEGRLATLAGDTLAKAVAEYEALQDGLGRIGSYAQLLYAGDMANPANTQFYQNAQEQLTVISSRLIFFGLEINKLSDAQLAKAYRQSKKLVHYAPWFDAVRSYKPYQLSDELEHYIHETSVTMGAWQRLFDESISRLEFTVDGKKMSEPQALDLLSGSDAKKRKSAAKEIARVFDENAPLFALITNTLAKAKHIEDEKRRFARPISSRNVSNQVEDEVVEALIATVQKNYRHLSHRYYAWKAKQFGKKTLDYWDRNAPLPTAGDKRIAWADGVKLVREAYHAFSPELAQIGQKFFDNNWIDVPVRAGKSPGAFAHPTVPSAHPYLLLNYLGKTRDVMTLAHELGHGVHQVLSAGQGALMADTPLTLAETASVFGEMLTFQELLNREGDAKRRQLLIAAKIEDMLNTVVRQIAFCEFERMVHDERRFGELSVERIGDIWMEVSRASLGPAITLHPEYRHYWMYIPHFIHSPFYVYAYAFGDCLVNSLYGVYLKEKKAGKAAAFAGKYLTMLRAGGTLRHKALLKPFGLDASKPDFWQAGLDVIGGYIDQLEK